MGRDGEGLLLYSSIGPQAASGFPFILDSFLDEGGEIKPPS